MMESLKRPIQSIKLVLRGYLFLACTDPEEHCHYNYQISSEIAIVCQVGITRSLAIIVDETSGF